MFAQIVAGHAGLADLLFLLAAVILGAAGLLAVTGRPDPTRGALVPFGLALLAVAWLVL